MSTTHDYFIPNLNLSLRREFPEYFAEISGKGRKERKAIKIIGDEEIDTLFRKYKEEGCLQSRDRLLLSQIRIVLKYVADLIPSLNLKGISNDDVFSMAYEAALLIITNYDKSKGMTFSSYIRNFSILYLRKSIKDISNIVRLPQNRINDLTSEKHLVEIFASKTGRLPREDEEFECNYNKKRVLVKFHKEQIVVKDDENNLSKIKRDNYIVRDTYPTDFTSSGLCDEFVYETDSEIEEDEVKTQLNESLSLLNEQEKEIVDLLFYKNHTLKYATHILTPSDISEFDMLEQTSANTIVISYDNLNGNREYKKINIDCRYSNNMSYSANVNLSEVDEVSLSTANDELELICKLPTISNIKIEQIYKDKHKSLDNYIYHKDKDVVTINTKLKRGYIFTTTTLISKRNTIIDKLRKNMIYEK